MAMLIIRYFWGLAMVFENLAHPVESLSRDCVQAVLRGSGMANIQTPGQEPCMHVL